MTNARTLAAFSLSVALLTGCDEAPPEQKRATDVARLDTLVVSLVDEIDV